MRVPEGLDKIILWGKEKVLWKSRLRDLKGHYNIAEDNPYLIRFLWFLRNKQLGRNPKGPTLKYIVLYSKHQMHQLRSCFSPVLFQHMYPGHVQHFKNLASFSRHFSEKISFIPLVLKQNIKYYLPLKMKHHLQNLSHCQGY